MPIVIVVAITVVVIISLIRVIVIIDADHQITTTRGRQLLVRCPLHLRWRIF